MDSQLKGFVTYKEIKYPFLYENKRLYLFPKEYGSPFMPAIFMWPSGERGKAIENIELLGTTLNNKNVIFEVSELCSDTEGFLSFEVYSVFEYNATYRRKISDDNNVVSESCKSEFQGMGFMGRDVDVFFPSNRAFTVDYCPEGEISNKVNVRRSEATELGSVEWKDIVLNFIAYRRITQRFSSTPLICRSVIVVTFSKSVDVGFLKEVYWAMLQTFRYLMRRNNIFFLPIEIFDISVDDKRRNIGELNMLANPVEQDDIKKFNKHGLTVDYIGNKFAALVGQFLDGRIYIDNLPESIASTKNFKPDRMLFDFVAFEREYANLYPESKARSEQYNTAKSLAVDAIDGLIEKRTGKIKKYLQTFKRRILADENSLASRWRHVISDCESILTPFLEYELNEQIFKEACEAAGESEDPLGFLVGSLNKLRNDMAHGNLDIHMDGVHMFGFELLETTLYVMRLKALGIDESVIQHGVARVMNINITLPEKNARGNEESEK